MHLNTTCKTLELFETYAEESKKYQQNSLQYFLPVEQTTRAELIPESL